MQTMTIFKAIRQALGKSFRNGFIGLIIGGGIVEGLAALLNRQGIDSFSGIFSTSPDMASYTLFVHVVAVLFGLTLASLMAVSTATMSAVRGLLNTADNAVDAVDGPKGHGLF